MPRKPRIDLPGFYHVINRGVNKEPIFLCDADKNEFLRLLGYVRSTYQLTVHAFCVLNNHYHLLIETRENNLSLAVRYLNAQYATYFNRKMKRVGPLWQGRFKSWYIYDEIYLRLVIRYIEMNPVKASVSDAIGKYRFSSSWLVCRFPDAALLADSLLHRKEIREWLAPLSEEEFKSFSTYQRARLEKRADQLIRRKRIELAEFFSTGEGVEQRNEAVWRAFHEGHTQGAIARYLNLSAVAVSRIVHREGLRRELFARLKEKGLFWSYAAETEYDIGKMNLLIETALKYADIADLKSLFDLFGTRAIRRVWEEQVKNDSRFKRLNYFLARVFFRMDVEASDFENLKTSRAEKLRLLAGQRAVRS